MQRVFVCAYGRTCKAIRVYGPQDAFMWVVLIPIFSDRDSDSAYHSPPPAPGSQTPRPFGRIGGTMSGSDDGSQCETRGASPVSEAVLLTRSNTQTTGEINRHYVGLVIDTNHDSFHTRGPLLAIHTFLLLARPSTTHTAFEYLPCPGCLCDMGNTAATFRNIRHFSIALANYKHG